MLSFQDLMNLLVNSSGATDNGFGTCFGGRWSAFEWLAPIRDGWAVMLVGGGRERRRQSFPESRIEIGEGVDRSSELEGVLHCFIFWGWASIPLFPLGELRDARVFPAKRSGCGNCVRALGHAVFADRLLNKPCSVCLDPGQVRC